MVKVQHNMAKRRKLNSDHTDEEATPRKSRRIDDSPLPSPTPLKSSLKQTPNRANGFLSVEATPSSLRKVLFATPSQVKESEKDDEIENDTPLAVRNDRSAHRKSQQTLLHHNDDESEDERDEAIASAILGDEDEDGDEDEEDLVALSEKIDLAATPTKKKKKIGRPRKKKVERTPSPPPNLPPHELFFFQSRAGGNKTSANTLPAGTLLSHEDYFSQIQSYQDPHAADISRLADLHAFAFDQWAFELSTNFNICLYGYGSKRELALSFAEHLHYQNPSKKTIIINGYTPDLTPKDILHTLAQTIFPPNKKNNPALSNPPLSLLLSNLSSPLNLIINSLDHPNLRKHQSLLSQLAAHPMISLLATVDTLTFPLLWDLQTATKFRFLYHDATTFSPWNAEIEVVEDVNALLGRSGARVGGREGVAFVLKSLPENARVLYRILVGEQLALQDSHTPVYPEDDDDVLSAEDGDGRKRRGKKGRPQKKKAASTPKKSTAEKLPEGVEYRTLYHKAVEEFVCSSEVNFRTLLKEFVDHRMVESRVDGQGAERLVVPFGRGELEGVLEDCVGG